MRSGRTPPYLGTSEESASIALIGTPAKPRSNARRIRHAAGLVVLLGLLGTLTISGCMERLFYLPSPGTTPPPVELGAEGVWFQSADGTKLFGWFIPAAGPADPPAPTVLHVHGNAGNLEGHIGFTDYLPAAGFNLFVFDYRGYGQSEGRARRREPLVADSHAALDALLARDDVDPERLGMYGQSLGGSIGLLLMAERDEIRAAVIESPFTSWREIAAAAVGGDPPGAVSRFLAGCLIKDHLRPIDAIERIERPILIIHGTADRTIPVSHGRRLAAAAPNAEFVELPGGDHNTLRWSHPEVDRLTIEFLHRHLAGHDVRHPETPARTADP
ncbi:MAG: alpha/beta hydrolase [Planctomycetota bacterium]